MVSFQCDGCGDVVKKPKLDSHRCHASFTCLDCTKTFRNPVEWKPHTSCISEAEKYEKSVYRGNRSGRTQGDVPPHDRGGGHGQPFQQGSRNPNRGAPRWNAQPSDFRSRSATGSNSIQGATMRAWGSNRPSPTPPTLDASTSATPMNNPLKHTLKNGVEGLNESGTISPSDTAVDAPETPKENPKKDRKKKKAKTADTDQHAEATDAPQVPAEPSTIAGSGPDREHRKSKKHRDKPTNGALKEKKRKRKESDGDETAVEQQAAEDKKERKKRRKQEKLEDGEADVPPKKRRKNHDSTEADAPGDQAEEASKEKKKEKKRRKEAANDGEGSKAKERKKERKEKKRKQNSVVA